MNLNWIMPAEGRRDDFWYGPYARGIGGFFIPDLLKKGEKKCSARSESRR
jgi:hypothetical protein